MEIKVLGTGCPKCKKLYELVQETVREVAVEAEVVKVEKIQDIMKYNVMLTPALIVNGVLKASGRLPSKAEISGWITK